jgi:hypothetical protein
MRGCWDGNEKSTVQQAGGLAMTASERFARAQELADRILRDPAAMAAYAQFVEAQLTRSRARRCCDDLLAVACGVLIMVVAIASCGILFGSALKLWSAQSGSPQRYW